MKNRVLRAVLLGAAVGGLVLGSTPAQAATVSWDDPKDDAVAAPFPNEPAYDITTVKLSNDGGKFTWDVAVPGLIAGRPTLSTGYTFRMLFTHGEMDFRIQVAENVLGQQSTTLSFVGGTLATTLACEKCEGKIDREAKKVVFTASLAALDKALQSAKAPALAGKEWSAISVQAGRPFSAPNPSNALPVTGVQFTTDTAAAPEGTTLQF